MASRRGRALTVGSAVAVSAALTLGAGPALATSDDPVPRLAGDLSHPGGRSRAILDLDLDGGHRILDLDGGHRILDLRLTIESPDGSLGVTDAGSQTTVTLATDVLFAFGKADLTPGARARIAQAAQALRSRGAAGVVTVSGHTDHIGSAASNQALSLKRAKAVAAVLGPQLAGLGLRLSPEGFGFRRPLVTERTRDGKDDPAARARNRRVEITFTAPS